MEAQNNFLTQAELFKSYAEQNHLYCNLSGDAMWFEYGGRRIGRLSLEIPQLIAARKHQALMAKGGYEDDPVPDVEPNNFQWRLRGKYRSVFPGHYSIVYLNDSDSWFVLGGNGSRDSNLHYMNRQIRVRAPMPHEKTFFPAVYHRGIIYTFGGYDAFEKCQLSSCEYYDVKADKWYNSHAPSFKLQQERSQASACLFDDTTIFVFGGYHRDEGTLNTIEKFDLAKKKISTMTLKIPMAIRRF